MNACSVVRPVGRSLWAACRSSRPAVLFSFGLLDGLSVRRVGLTCEKPRRASVSNASRRHS
jgi:hypothetical protein